MYFNVVDLVSVLVLVVLSLQTSLQQPQNLDLEFIDFTDADPTVALTCNCNQVTDT